jgi:hypothetical protein
MQTSVPATFFSWLKLDASKGHSMADTAPDVLAPLVEHILDDLAGLPAEQVADALAVAFARHCKDKFDAPGLERGFGYVDTTVKDKVLGEIEVRVTVFRKVPPVDRNRQYRPKEPEDVS